MSVIIGSAVQAAVIYLAGGCFWGMQAYFNNVQGVIDTEVGYANATIERPKYEDVNSDYAETIKITYNKNEVPLSFILDMYFAVIDPTSVNKQGGDHGRQYRTGIYFVNNEDEPIIKEALARLQTKYTQPIVVECMPLKSFYPAEEYHQEYLKKNPNGYCHIGKQVINAAKNIRYKDEAALRKQLTPIQYHVTQENGTEAPFQNEYYNNFEEGIYVDVVSGKPLFLSTDKFESGCGWPAFSKPIDESLIKEKEDRSHGMIRTEVRSKDSDSHLGHLFYDGPAELGGTRYCINSAALRFIPKSKMAAEGYADYLPLLEKK